MRPLVLWIVAMAVLTTTAVAQPSPSPGPEATARNLWSCQRATKYSRCATSPRSGRPPDASPISWRGSGPSVSGRYDIIRRRSAHVIEAMAARARDFSYAGPSRSTLALHRWVRNNPTRVIAIADLVTTWNSNSNDGYRASASFLAFLIEHYGTARLKLVYHAPSAQLPARMHEAYGVPLQALETEWRRALE